MQTTKHRASDAVPRGMPARRAGRRRGTWRTTARACAAAAAAVLAVPAAQAAPPSIQMPTDETLQTGTQPATGPLDFVTGIGRSSYLLGDMWGLRTALNRYGISFALQETSEVLGNVTGGVKQGAAYDGLTQMSLQLDTKKAFGWAGGTFNVSALQIHGSNLSADNLYTLQTASGIEAEPGARLWELWYQQKFLDGKLDIKVGQQSLDQEFMVSQGGLSLINTMFGWPMVPSADMPGGGPAYPLSAPGIRVRAHPADAWTILAGVFNGSPAPSNAGDAQMLDPSGTSFPLNGGILAIAEAQYSYPSAGTMLYAGQSEPLARTYKLGAWYDSESFPDQQYDSSGLSLANPLSSGVPRQHRGDFGLYAVADQLVWVDPRETDRTISLFGRVMGAPQADRNLVTFALNAGMTFHEPFLHRDDDTFAIGLGYARVGSATAALDKATAFYTGTYVPTRGGETFVEITYQYEIAPWWQVQPDLQYVINPGGGLANPDDPDQRIRNELVLGLRTIITF